MGFHRPWEPLSSLDYIRGLELYFTKQNRGSMIQKIKTMHNEKG